MSTIPAANSDIDTSSEFTAGVDDTIVHYPVIYIDRGNTSGKLATHAVNLPQVSTTPLVNNDNNIRLQSASMNENLV
jgi:hypothetical protein